MTTRIGHPSPIDPVTITAILGLIKAGWDFFSKKKLGVDPGVEKAISAVEAEVGLSRDVMWAWNWFDHRYLAELGKTYWDEDWDNARYEKALDEVGRTGNVSGFDSWHSYSYYASHSMSFWEDINHWVKMVKGSYGRIEYHLTEEMKRLAAEIGYDIKPWYKKYLPYGVMAGLAIALILVLTGGRREPRIIYLPPEKK